MKTHWLYGEGKLKVLKFVKEVDEETKCSRCFHQKVCFQEMESRCVNFEFGTSEHRGCGGCRHKFTRFDKESVPCFHCDDFVDMNKVSVKS